ncbi:hypothetical protein DFH09DRAFT_154090 [Mycena vulgaris]|nr:hypothetical protein DFH09DRAFT_154090 [Mycena vulgaris]
MSAFPTRMTPLMGIPDSERGPRGGKGASAFDQSRAMFPLRTRCRVVLTMWSRIPMPVRGKATCIQYYVPFRPLSLLMVVILPAAAAASPPHILLVLLDILLVVPSATPCPAPPSHVHTRFSISLFLFLVFEHPVSRIPHTHNHTFPCWN